MEMETVETETKETETKETKTAVTKTAETKTAETKTAETKTAETKTIEMETTEKKVAYVSTCGAGHLNTLRSLWEKDPSSHLFLLRCKDEANPFDLADEQGVDRLTVITLNETRQSEVASEFNEQRYRKLRGPLRIWIYDFRPTLIVYDFFCLEAREVARFLGIPAICSIPATLKTDETNTCSDAILPDEHFYWIWRQPYQVALKPVAFLGSRHHHCAWTSAQMSGFKQWKNVALVTFGTVVPKYDGCQERLRQIMTQVEELVDKYQETLFVFAGVQGPTNRRNCQNGRELDIVTLLSGVHVPLIAKKSDQRKQFVTHVLFHGGGNTFSEALQARVPYLLACPFFGDQFETARQCGNVYSGDLLADWSNLSPYPYFNGPSNTLSLPFQDNFVDYWRKGDLLFGHRRHRDTFQVKFPMIDFHLNHYAKFYTFANPTNGDLPAIADVYNDELDHMFPDLCSQIEDGQTEYQSRLKDVYEERMRNPHLDLPEEHRLVHYCIQMLWLMKDKWQGRIHFVLGPREEIGLATNMELDEIRTYWTCFNDCVIFYNLQGKRIPTPLDRPVKNYKTTATVSILNPLEHRIPLPLMKIRGRMPLVWGRRKSSESETEKICWRQLPVYDLQAWRTGYMNKEDLSLVLKHVDPSFEVSVNWCRQNVWFFYYSTNTELQVWPWVYLHCFQKNMAGIETDRDAQYEAYEAIKDTHF